MTARTLEPFDAAAVAPWSVGDGPRAALMLHGFAGTPPELRRLGEHLAAHGWRCVAPALHGHARTPEALESSTWEQWAADAQRALDELAAAHETVVVAGQSMGGALALHVAATDLRVGAVASLATPLWLSGLLQHFLPVMRHVVRWHRPGTDVDLWDPTAVEELHSYGLRSVHAINELKRLLAVVRDELPQVRAPVMALHGGRDRMIDPACTAELTRRLVCSREVDARVYPRSGHAISVDVDRDDINARVLGWFERHTAVVPAEVSAAG
ncbi:MAG: alpha/beta fold hydrolase [Candidatus Dormibacteraeota bacterium]|nr:alpha/beta fold hydrolase [Candidatus Dormibacteraeota bacterium]MBV9525811.1 alpha/beta fold hydrolase [Candidatus Dormibacteraeota bacterium]